MRILFLPLMLMIPHAAAAEEKPLQLTPSLVAQTSAISYGLKQDPNDLDNARQRLPIFTLLEDIKPNLKVVAGSSFQLQLRPRLHASYVGRRIANKAETPESETKTYWQEAFMQWNVSDRTSLIWGRQNFQWGAAESFNASNRMVHDLVVGRQNWTETLGKDMVRVNFTPMQNLSIIVAAEVQQNRDEAEYQAGQEFQQQGFVKGEWSWNAGADYFGVVAGGRQHDPGWLGAYANVSVPFWDGLSLYADSSFEHGSRAFYPDQQGPRVVWDASLAEDAKVKALVIGGAKFDFTNGGILRAEYIYNQAGYSKEQWQLRQDYYQKTPAPQLFGDKVNLERAQFTGLDLLRQRYVYASFYMPDLFWKDFNFSLRTFQSVEESSGTNYANFEYYVTEAGALLFSESVNSGVATGEWRRGVQAVHALGYRQQW